VEHLNETETFRLILVARALRIEMEKLSVDRLSLKAAVCRTLCSMKATRASFQIKEAEAKIFEADLSRWIL
jgi:hypothetical protein